MFGQQETLEYTTVPIVAYQAAPSTVV